MVASQKCFEPKHFPIREIVQTPLILHSGGSERLKGEI
jgi:hypothetical protein